MNAPVPRLAPMVAAKLAPVPMPSAGVSPGASPLVSRALPPLKKSPALPQTAPLPALKASPAKLPSPGHESAADDEQRVAAKKIGQALAHSAADPSAAWAAHQRLRETELASLGQ